MEKHADNVNHEPRLFRGVTISSTFSDLEAHRAALISALKGQGLTDVAMENDSAKPGVDVVESSLRMVRDGSAYIGVIGLKYGQTPFGDLSLTEMEFDEAIRLDRPILLFIMGDGHLVHKQDIETDPVKLVKLNAFRERAKQMRPDSPVHRVWASFDSLEEFREKAIHAVADLRRFLDEKAAPVAVVGGAPERDPIPVPPAFYAEPKYIGSHEFVGRGSQLEDLNEWAKPADAHPVLLFEAIGGSGKSMLTWEWATKRATQVRGDWAGRFWYSFYEGGGIMADFCRHALAYMIGEPLDNFKKQKTAELSKLLLHRLQAKPWLLVLDGLERVLVAYHRYDAAQVSDEEANAPTDQIAQRDPCAAIRPEDDDLLRALAAATPSKVLITTRLVPRVLLNQASQPIPGVLRVSLPGLRPSDAEALIRSCGVRGDSGAIQNYLKSNCDCHPLVTGVLAGLINEYFPDRGNFDAWAADAEGGGKLNLAELDLVQKRNHILAASLAAVPEKGRQLLSILALMSEVVDWETLSALHADLPGRELGETVRDLERRGLLQYERSSGKYDLHPVVRGVAAGKLGQEETNGFGRRVVDYFSPRPHSPYEEAETLDEVRDGLHVVRTLLKMGRYQEACDAYRGELSYALFSNLEANAEVLSLLLPFFPKGWAFLPGGVDGDDGSYLANDAALALSRVGEGDQSLAAYGAALAADVRAAKWNELCSGLSNICGTLDEQNRLALAQRFREWNLDLAVLIADRGQVFRLRLDLFAQLAKSGKWDAAQAMWDLLDPMGRHWNRAVYRPGYAEFWYATFRFWRGDLSEELLSQAERLAKAGKDRALIRHLHWLRGEWHMERGEWELAAESLREAVSMARAVGRTGASAETLLALARFRLGELDDPRREAEQLASATPVSHRRLSELWLAIRDSEQAKKHALAAYKRAWADGEPYVRRYELNKARALLETLGVEIPDLPAYDPAREEKFPWEDDVVAAIAKLRAEKEAEGDGG